MPVENIIHHDDGGCLNLSRLHLSLTLELPVKIKFSKNFPHTLLRSVFYGAILFLSSFLFFSTSVRAETLNVTAEFRPSAANPRVDKFENTTPVAGFCLDYQRFCGEGVFSIATNLNVNNRSLIAGSNNNNERVFQKLDANWKTISLTDDETGQSITVQFRLMLIGQRFSRSGGGFVTADFNSAGGYPQGGCGGTIGAGIANSYFRFAWNHSSLPASCYRNVVNMNYTDFKISDISVGYEMKSSSPMNMPNGTFKGSVSYSVGNGQQIDLGAGDYSDNILEIKIEAQIEHELKFEMVGSEKVPMIPPGGWQDWTSGGATQFRLEGTGSFRTTASAPFSVYLECQHKVLNSCAMQREGDDTLVQVDTTITIPFVIERVSGEDITNWPIYVRSIHTPDYVFEPRSYINAFLSTVKFSVNQVESLRMGNYPGSTWRGSATLIFDAEINSP